VWFVNSRKQINTLIEFVLKARSNLFEVRPNKRLQLTAFGARDRAFFEALLCRAPRRQLKRNTLGAGHQCLCLSKATRMVHCAKLIGNDQAILDMIVILFKESGDG